jgi:hypothetical protein
MNVPERKEERRERRRIGGGRRGRGRVSLPVSRRSPRHIL